MPRKDPECIEIDLPGFKPDQIEHIKKLLSHESWGWPALLKVYVPIVQRQMARARQRREEMRQGKLP
jgi:hypothetical protein